MMYKFRTTVEYMALLLLDTKALSAHNVVESQRHDSGLDYIDKKLIVEQLSDEAEASKLRRTQRSIRSTFNGFSSCLELRHSVHLFPKREFKKSMSCSQSRLLKTNCLTKTTVDEKWHSRGGSKTDSDRARKEDSIEHPQPTDTILTMRQLHNKTITKRLEPDDGPKDGQAPLTYGRTEEIQQSIPCQYYLRTATCLYGDRCKFYHPPNHKPPELNENGYPVRIGTKDCTFYLKHGFCGFGATCKYHHPPLKTVFAKTYFRTQEVHYGSERYSQFKGSNKHWPAIMPNGWYAVPQGLAFPPFYAPMTPSSFLHPLVTSAPYPYIHTYPMGVIKNEPSSYQMTENQDKTLGLASRMCYTSEADQSTPKPHVVYDSDNNSDTSLEHGRSWSS